MRRERLAVFALARFAIALVAMMIAVSSPVEAAPVKSKSKPKSQAAPSGAPPTHRTVIHTEAYKQREGLGPHLNIKITPPEKRGRKGRVLVEAYNYSKTYLNVVDFWLYLSNAWGDRVEVHITCDDIKPGWSALKWVKIPGNKPIPEITKVEIKNMSMFNEKGERIKLKYYTDLIKK